MLKITMKDGRSRWIAVAHVCHIGEGEPGMCNVVFDNGMMLTTREDPEELAATIHKMLVAA